MSKWKRGKKSNSIQSKERRTRALYNLEKRLEETNAHKKVAENDLKRVKKEEKLGNYKKEIETLEREISRDDKEIKRMEKEIETLKQRI